MTERFRQLEDYKIEEESKGQEESLEVMTFKIGEKDVMVLARYLIGGKIYIYDTIVQ